MFFALLPSGVFTALRRSVVVAVAGCLALAGCSKPTTQDTGAGEYEVAELRYQGFIGAVTYPELAEALGYLEPIKLSYVGNTISGPQDIQSVVTGDVDFGGAFNGAIIKLVAARAPIQAVVGMYGVDDDTWGGFYVNEDSPIRGPHDLLGKKIAVNTLGAHSELMLKEYLERGGVTREQTAEQVTLVVVPPIWIDWLTKDGQLASGAVVASDVFSNDYNPFAQGVR